MGKFEWALDMRDRASKAFHENHGKGSFLMSCCRQLLVIASS